MAGAFRCMSNTSYYLHNEATIGSKMWWTMIPYRFFNSNALGFSSDGIYSSLDNYIVDYNLSFRPVINLWADLIVESGDGTSGSGAYKVKLPN